MTRATTSLEQQVRDTLEESIAVKRALLDDDLSTVVEIAERIVVTFRSGGKILLFGNGGSAADAQHVAAELVNRFQVDRAALPALALATDTSILTAIANDGSFEDVFARQVEGLAQEGDAVVGISTSGKAANVCRGVEAARRHGAATIGFSGREGGDLKGLVDLCFCVPSDDTARIQETHIAVWHAICDIVEQELFA
jgi:D-sedoheptulose 7-phosphate isomerase